MANKIKLELIVDDKGNVVVKRFGKESEKSFDKVERSAKKTGSTLKKLGVAVAAIFAVTRIKAWASDWVRLAGVQEKAVISLEQAMRNAGTYRKQDLEGLKDYASALQEVTTYGDEATLATMANLQAYGMEIAELMKATKATQDLAAAKNMDLRAASELVGKAFVGETSTLSRYGIILDEGVKKGDKFAAVMELIAERFGGQAEALASTGYGGLEQLSNLWGDTKEQLGELVLAITQNLLPALKSWAGWLKDIAEYWGKVLRGPETVLEYLQKQRKELAGQVETLRTRMSTDSAYAQMLKAQGVSVDEVTDQYKSQIAILEKRISLIDRSIAEEQRLAAETGKGGGGGAGGGGDRPPGGDEYAGFIQELNQQMLKEDAARLEASMSQLDAALIAQGEREIEHMEFMRDVKQQAWEEEITATADAMSQLDDILQQQADREIEIEQYKQRSKMQIDKNWFSFSVSLANSLYALSGRQSKALFYISKAAGVAQATVSAFVAYGKALAAMPLFPTYAHSVLALGLANAAAIGAVAIGGGPGGAPGGGIGAAPMPTYPASPYTDVPKLGPEKEEKGRTLNIHIYGDVYGKEEFVRHLMEEINMRVANSGETLISTELYT
ncbi:MAG: hypothetical protein JRF50_12910 [Deltaproteobacteria bacterium]|nr:hypothetical protein [Deltaproteobacteria bacterium]